MKIGYQGVNGSFSQMAVNRYFAGEEYEENTYSDFNDMFIDVAEGKLDYGMFPVENTTTGIITRTYDLFQYYDLHAVGEVIVPVDQNLIGFPGAKIEEIRGVYSHPEAIAQCQSFFKNNSHVRPIVYEDTALSVKYVKESGDHRKAAIASKLAAEQNGMEILMPKIQDNVHNMTRFLCVTAKNEEVEDADKISIMMVLKHSHDPGALYHTLGIFASKNLNIVKLESRPIFGKVFEYCFYLDFLGNPKDPDVVEVLRRLEYDCQSVKVFGAYKADRSELTHQ